ncbi:MAG: hypothetical protein H7Y36_07025 [Armatimonadetes bacterium]|nr:hypothetical protein [Akkermansiaceae bacterium]
MDDASDIDERKPQPIDETDDDLCRALWLAVAIQGLLDACGNGCTGLDQAKALEWLEGRGKDQSDFATVCNLAGVDIEKTRTRFVKVVQGEAASIDFRCMKRALPKNRTSESRHQFLRRARKNAATRLAAKPTAKIIPFTTNQTGQPNPIGQANGNDPKVFATGEILCAQLVDLPGGVRAELSARDDNTHSLG